MTKTLSYCFPSDSPLLLPNLVTGAVIELISHVPDHLNKVKGELRAPKHLVDSGKASPFVGYFFANNTTQIIRQISVSGRHDMVPVMLGTKLPLKVEFGDDRCCEVINIDEIKDISSNFVNLGYYGLLRFGWEDSLESLSCEIDLSPSRRLGVIFRHEEELVTLDSIRCYFSGIMSFCQSLGMEKTEY